ncbi:MAG: ABZJ_00895 family protein [Pseudomonadota bacterium]
MAALCRDFAVAYAIGTLIVNLLGAAGGDGIGTVGGFIALIAAVFYAGHQHDDRIVSPETGPFYWRAALYMSLIAMVLGLGLSLPFLAASDDGTTAELVELLQTMGIGKTLASALMVTAVDLLFIRITFRFAVKQADRAPG